MGLDLVAVTFEAHDPDTVSGFWAVLLGRYVVRQACDAFLPGDATQVGLRFVAATTDKNDPDRLHLHLTSTTPDDRRHTIETALSLGGRHLDVGQRPEETHVVLGDPDGNAFCVIEPGNGYLEGCGRLGEVARDGTRDVGLFWQAALGWPLVWDQGEETAIQSPFGGTKISWGGPPVPVKSHRCRQRFELSATDLSGEVSRLVALGATEVESRAGTVELADPDGNEFHVAPR